MRACTRAGRLRPGGVDAWAIWQAFADKPQQILDQTIAFFPMKRDAFLHSNASKNAPYSA